VAAAIPRSRVVVAVPRFGGAVGAAPNRRASGVGASGRTSGGDTEAPRRRHSRGMRASDNIAPEAGVVALPFSSGGGTP
jgi:hypothetical protein